MARRKKVETKIETSELQLDELIRGADGDEGDVRDALCEPRLLMGVPY
jgi:hypothetical protein